MDHTVLMVAIASTLIFVCYSLVAIYMGETHGADPHAGGAAEGFSVLQFFSIQSVLLALMSYSWGWLFWTKEMDSSLLAVGATLASGTFMVSLYVFGMRSLRQLNTSDQIREFEPQIGMHGSVYSTIPASGKGNGIITILCPNRGDFQFQANSLEESPIATGTNVVITELNLPSNLTVRTA